MLTAVFAFGALLVNCRRAGVRARRTANIHLDGGGHSLALRGAYVELAIEGVDARIDVREAHTAIHHSLRIEAAAIVRILQLQKIARRREREAYLAAARVLERVGNKLAHNAVHNNLDVGIVALATQVRSE